MGLKLISALAIFLQVILKLVEYFSAEKERLAGREEERNLNKKILEDEIEGANAIRANAGSIDDDILLKPEQRSGNSGRL